MKYLKNVLSYWKHGLRKIRVSATAVIGGLLLTSCCSQKELVQPTIKIVPAHKIDTCFVVKSDTVLCFETDTLRVETIVRDTILRLKVETKPIIVRDTIISKIEQEKAKKNEEKAKENPKKTKIFLAFLLCFIVSAFLTFRKKK
jgi:hypothetical protein